VVVRAAPFALILALAGVARASSASAAPSSAADSASELVRQAHEHEPTDELLALRRYAEALAIDPSNDEAYLGLAALRRRRGDLREAEHVYDVALSRLPSLGAALVGRAEARWELGMHDAAEKDLERYSLGTSDPAVLKELAGWYASDARSLAQLATWRRIHAVALAQPDAALEREARAMVRALQIVVGAADPVAAPATSDPVRRGIALVAKRGG
jgi:tetratricopeptide (TPR) repeat protein